MNYKDLKELVALPGVARECTRESNELMEKIRDHRWELFRQRLSEHVGPEMADKITNDIRHSRKQPPTFRLRHVGDWTREWIKNGREEQKEAG